MLCALFVSLCSEVINKLKHVYFNFYLHLSLSLQIVLIFFMQDGSNSILTNYFKVALLPHALFSKAVKLCKSYEEGQLQPPSSTKQRQRRSISASTFNFLRGLNPQVAEDQQIIARKLDDWLETKAKPSIEKVPNGKIIISCSFL